ncbi:hypothetical protein AYO44_06320 [Planctomycetaceae bacterium SCGC AG-212-F19]|nr:hypothetical protein AYO44_06320 [Planctomycetaceae bacterium SCGC AG-212-F19]
MTGAACVFLSHLTLSTEYESQRRIASSPWNRVEGDAVTDSFTPFIRLGNRLLNVQQIAEIRDVRAQDYRGRSCEVVCSAGTVTYLNVSEYRQLLHVLGRLREAGSIRIFAAPKTRRVRNLPLDLPGE